MLLLRDKKLQSVLACRESKSEVRTGRQQRFESLDCEFRKLVIRSRQADQEIDGYLNVLVHRLHSHLLLGNVTNCWSI